MDKGREICDKELAKMERKIRMEYEKALKEMKKKSADYFERFEENDKKKKEQVESGKLSRDEYLTWRRNKMLSGQYYTDMVENLSQDLSNAREHAQAIIRDELPDIYAESANWASYEVENGLNIDTGFTLVDRNTVKELLQNDQSLLPVPRVNIPKEQRWNKQKLNSAILQGVITGESIPQIAKRLRTVTDMSKNAAIRNARTMTTGAENRGRVDSYKRAEKMGIKLHQRWLATHDSKTRQTHRYIDGEVQEVGERFSNGCRYPGDPLGAPAEVYNCRCTLIAALDDYPDNFYKNFETIDGMSYEEWKGRKAETAETKKEAPKAQAPSYTPVTNKAESLKELGKLFGSIAQGFKSIDEGLMVANTNRLLELNARFHAIKPENKGELSSRKYKRAIAWTSTSYNNRTQNTDLSLVATYYKDPSTLKSAFERARKSFWNMPASDEYWNTYVVTHEYGHILEAAISKSRTEWGTKFDADIVADPRAEHKKQAKGIMKEIVAIAKKDNPNFKLSEQLSEYGRTNDFEMFAEVFANSQCGQPNQLGNAMIKWLKKEGY